MKGKIIKIGSSLGVIIPNYVVKTAKLKKGTPINIEFSDNKIIITKVEEKRKGWKEAFKKFAEENN